MQTKKDCLCLIVGFFGAILGLYGVESFNQFVLMSLPLGLRMLSTPIIYWLIAAIPVIVMLSNKDKCVDCGFSKTKIISQVLVGVFVGVAMSFILTLVPHLFGFGAYVDSGKRYQYLWQFGYEFFYCIIAIGFVEELVFRGFIYNKIKKISQKEDTAIIGSSVLFGVFHLFSGNLIQMVMTAFIGAFLCFCRLKIKNCSTLSLIIAHGIYDALITVLASTLL